MISLGLVLVAVLLVGASAENVTKEHNQFCVRWQSQSLEERQMRASAKVAMIILNDYGHLSASDKDALQRCVEKADLGTAISIKLACSIGSNRDFQAGFSQAASIYKVLDKCTHRDL